MTFDEPQKGRLFSLLDLEHKRVGLEPKWLEPEWLLSNQFGQFGTYR